MANPIVTTWTSGSTTTPHGPGQTVVQWEDNHVARATSELGEDPPDQGFPITSTWTSGGVPQTVTTSHQGSETTPQWIARHWDAVRARMADFPPDLPSGLLARLVRCGRRTLEPRPRYRLAVVVSKDGWRVNVRAANGELLMQSEAYTRRADALRAADSLSRARLELER